METSFTPTVLTTDEVLELPSVQLGAHEGVTHQVLWQDGTSMAGLLAVEAGHHLGAHQHRTHSHHLWVREGRVEILGVELGPGAYVHIPSGILHDIDARATEGCTLLYVYAI